MGGEGNEIVVELWWECTSEMAMSIVLVGDRRFSGQSKELRVCIEKGILKYNMYEVAKYDGNDQTE